MRRYQLELAGIGTMTDQDPSRLAADSWITVAKLAAAASVLVLALEIVLLINVTPGPRCPAWVLNGNSLWPLVAFWTGPIAVFTCLAAAQWKWVARQEIEQEGKPRRLLFGLVVINNPPIPMPATHLIARICVATAFTSAFPLALVVHCADWIRV